MTNEEFVRRACEIAEFRDISAWIDCFNPDGVPGNLGAVLEPQAAQSA